LMPLGNSTRLPVGMPPSHDLEDFKKKLRRYYEMTCSSLVVMGWGSVVCL
jgi:hypothetical protein